LGAPAHTSGKSKKKIIFCFIQQMKLFGGLDMSSELLAVIAGGAIGILGGLLTSGLGLWWSERKAKKAISTAIVAQIKFAKGKVKRYKAGEITLPEFAAGKPLFKAFADNVGNLSPKQATDSTEALLLYFEFAESGKIERADEVIAACDKALRSFKSE